MSNDNGKVIIISNIHKYEYNLKQRYRLLNESKVIPVEPRVNDDDFFTNLSHEKTGKIGEEELRINEERFRLAQQRSIEEEEAEMRRKKILDTAVKIGKLAMLAAGAVLSYKYFAAIEEKWPENPKTDDQNPSISDNDSQEMNDKSVSKKIEDYSNTVRTIIASTDTNDQRHYDKIIYGIKVHLLRSANDDLDYRCAVLAVANVVSNDECEQFLNKIFGDFAQKDTKGYVHLLNVSNLNEYLKMLGYKSIDELRDKEGDVLRQLYHMRELEGAQREVDEAFMNGKISWDYMTGGRK